MNESVPPFGEFLGLIDFLEPWGDVAASSLYNF